MQKVLMKVIIWASLEGEKECRCVGRQESQRKGQCGHVVLNGKLKNVDFLLEIS